MKNRILEFRERLRRNRFQLRSRTSAERGETTARDVMFRLKCRDADANANTKIRSANIRNDNILGDLRSHQTSPSKINPPCSVSERR